MAYTPVNVGAFTAAYSGAISGMVGAWLFDPSQTDYTAVTEIAGAFAQAFDLGWNNAKALNSLERSTIEAVASAAFSSRSPGLGSESLQEAAGWSGPAAACAELVRQSGAYFSGQGINAALANPYLAQENWWIDSVLGNDSNPGTQALPLRTTTEFCNRICPEGAKATLTTAINCFLVGAGPYQDFALNLDCPPEAGSNVYGVGVFGTLTSSAPMVLSAVTNPVPSTKTRQVLTTLDGAFVDLLRIRVTSGPQTGALAFSTGLNGGPLSTFASAFMSPTNGHNVTVAPGNTVVVDTLQTVIKQFQVTLFNQAYFFVEDVIIQRGAHGFSSVQFNRQNLQIYGCAASYMPGQTFVGPFVCFATSFVNPFFVDGTVAQWGCIYQNGVCVVQNGYLDTRDCNTFDNSSLIVNQNAQWNVGSGGVEFVRGTAGAIAVQMGVESTAQITGYCWGASTSYGQGFNVLSGASMVSVLAAYLAIPSIVNMQLSGTALTYSGFVGANKQRAGCYISLFNDTAAAVNTA